MFFRPFLPSVLVSFIHFQLIQFVVCFAFVMFNVIFDERQVMLALVFLLVPTAFLTQRCHGFRFD